MLIANQEVESPFTFVSVEMAGNPDAYGAAAFDSEVQVSHPLMLKN